MGVWIETPLKLVKSYRVIVTPCVGVWIETYWEMISDLENGVTPCVGVWIETAGTPCYQDVVRSHTLRGCVD